MKKDEKKSKKKKWLIGTGAVLAVLLIGGYCVARHYFYSQLLAGDEKVYIYVDKDDNVDSVLNKVEAVAEPDAMKGFRKAVSLKDYGSNIKRGRYELNKNASAWSFTNTLLRGEQTPLNVPVPSVRTLDRLAAAVGKKLELDSLELLNTLNDPAVCKQYGFEPHTIAAMFIPDSYNMYWTVSIKEFLDRMKQEYDKFWNEERKNKAKEIGFTPNEVATLASIVTEETRNTAEKPTIAGLYINRLHKNMLLQSDPTVKFALKDFAARRIYNSMLTVDDPYNTYKYAGLPPGPIKIPLKEDLDAVLNYQHHDYIYMCAKETFDGTHNFAKTIGEHNANATRYWRALNERGIK